MDQELIAYLDRRFGSVDERFESMDQRFESIDQRFESIDQRFETMDQRLKGLHGEMNARFDRADQRFEKLEETAHLTQITVESLRDDIRLTAEGVMGFTDILEARSIEIDEKLDDLKALIGPVYKSLEKKTDSQASKLSRRVVILEDRAKRETRDILEILREKYGFQALGRTGA
jgi:chromosome segregation ATPase